MSLRARSELISICRQLQAFLPLRKRCNANDLSSKQFIIELNGMISQLDEDFANMIHAQEQKVQQNAVNLSLLLYRNTISVRS